MVFSDVIRRQVTRQIYHTQLFTVFFVTGRPLVDRGV